MGDTIDRFRDMLQKLRNSQNRIEEATKFWLGNTDNWEILYQLIRNRLNEPLSLDKRVAVLYLVDSICQQSCMRGIECYKDAFAAELPLLVVDLWSGPRERRRDRETVLTGDEARRKIGKVLENWRRKSVFEDEVIESAKAALDECVEATNDSSPNAVYSDGREQGGTPAKHSPIQNMDFPQGAPPVDPRHGEIVKWLDQDRRERRRRNQESLFRPENDTESGEFEEWWENVPPINEPKPSRQELLESINLRYTREDTLSCLLCCCSCDTYDHLLDHMARNQTHRRKVESVLQRQYALQGIINVEFAVPTNSKTNLPPPHTGAPHPPDVTSGKEEKTGGDMDIDIDDLLEKGLETAEQRKREADAAAEKKRAIAWADLREKRKQFRASVGGAGVSESGTGGEEKGKGKEKEGGEDGKARDRKDDRSGGLGKRGGGRDGESDRWRGRGGDRGGRDEFGRTRSEGYGGRDEFGREREGPAVVEEKGPAPRGVRERERSISPPRRGRGARYSPQRSPEYMPYSPPYRSPEREWGGWRDGGRNRRGRGGRRGMSPPGRRVWEEEERRRGGYGREREFVEDWVDEDTWRERQRVEMEGRKERREEGKGKERGKSKDKDKKTDGKGKGEKDGGKHGGKEKDKKDKSRDRSVEKSHKDKEKDRKERRKSESRKTVDDKKEAETPKKGKEGRDEKSKGSDRKEASEKKEERLESGGKGMEERDKKKETRKDTEEHTAELKVEKGSAKEQVKKEEEHGDKKETNEEPVKKKEEAVGKGGEKEGDRDEKRKTSTASSEEKESKIETKHTKEDARMKETEKDGKNDVSLRRKGSAGHEGEQGTDKHAHTNDEKKNETENDRGKKTSEEEHKGSVKRKQPGDKGEEGEIVNKGGSTRHRRRLSESESGGRGGQGSDRNSVWNRVGPRNDSVGQSGRAVPRGQGIESRIVRIWDLDETLIIFTTLLNGQYARFHKLDEDDGKKLGKGLEDLIYRVLDGVLLYRDLEPSPHQNVMDFDFRDDGLDLSTSVVHCSDWPIIRGYNFDTDGFDPNWRGPERPNNPEWLHHSRLMAYRYRYIRFVYEDAARNLKSLIPPRLYKKWQAIFEDIDAFTSGWPTVSGLLLQAATQSDNNSINVMVTTTELVPALAKVLLFGLGEYFPPDLIYSSKPAGKLSCFRTIVDRFGPHSRYISIGDGEEERDAARALKMESCMITTLPSLKDLYVEIKSGKM